MKKLKNNRGVTGIDIVVSVLIIVMSIGLIGVMYSRYSKKSKEIERNTQAINLAINVIEKVKATDYDTFRDIFIVTDAYGNFDRFFEYIQIGIDGEVFENGFSNSTNIVLKDFFNLNNIPGGYLVKIFQEETTQGLITILKVKVEVEYNIGKEIKTITLNTNKIKDQTLEEANTPDLTMSEVNQTIDGYTKYLLKYSNSKKGYIKARQMDDDWYSISGKKFAIVAYAKETDFDVNGVIDLEKCNKIYLWVPRFGKVDTTETYGFCFEKTDNMIIYGNTEKSISDTANEEINYNIIGYTVDTSKKLKEISTEFKDVTGKWIQVEWDNENSKIISSNQIYIDLTTKQFIWEKQGT